MTFDDEFYITSNSIPLSIYERLRRNSISIEYSADPSCSAVIPYRRNQIDYTSFYINPNVKKIIFNGPATIVLWEDGTKTVVKCQEGDVFDKEKGIALCFMKKHCHNKANFNNILKKWVKEENDD